MNRQKQLLNLTGVYASLGVMMLRESPDVGAHVVANARRYAERLDELASHSPELRALLDEMIERQG